MTDLASPGSPSERHCVQSNVLTLPRPETRTARRRVLHVGCGYPSTHRLHAAFRDADDWMEIRLDIDPAVRPDIVCSTVDMSASVPASSVDAIWSSHNVEHLHDHEAALAFAEFRRVLNAGGFTLMRCPDLRSVCESLLEHGLEHVAYESPAGPITPLDMLYGHRASIGAGNAYMAHHTGYTDEKLGRMLLEAGFAEVRTLRAPGFDLWALAFAPRADVDFWLAHFARCGLDFDA